MSNYKIRVNSEAESKEAQELFFELDYNWFKKGYVEVKTPETIMSFENGALTTGIRGSINHKEITLPELRDLVVLKRNNREDANVSEENCLYDLYLTESKELYFYHCGKNKWILSNLNGDDDYYESLKPIEKKEMKEYLDPENGYKLNLTDRPFFDWIEIPEGATYYAKDASLGKNGNFFFRLRSDDFDFEAVWLESNWIQAIFNVENQDVLWQRHTLPEELPFIDDECYTNKSDGVFRLPISEPCDISNWVEIREEGSLNDQYAEIETVRKKIRENNHYFIDVSDVDEVDFYEIAKRYNVTDPAIQHILKKCLAIGNRGHKDLETDLMDILKTAKRALRINGFGEPK